MSHEDPLITYTREKFSPRSSSCYEREIDRLRAVNGQLLVALEALHADSKEFHDFPDIDEVRSGAHTNCGWCLAEAAIAEAQKATGGQ